MSHHSVCSKCHKPVEWLLSKLASWDWGRNEGGGSALIYVRSLLCRCNNHLRVITFLNLAVKVPDFVSLEVCTAVAESAAAVIVTLLLPVFGKEHCLIMILKDGLCTLEPVGRKICRVCTELCRKTRTLFFFFEHGPVTVLTYILLCTSCFLLNLWLPVSCMWFSYFWGVEKATGLLWYCVRWWLTRLRWGTGSEMGGFNRVCSLP